MRKKGAKIIAKHSIVSFIFGHADLICKVVIVLIFKNLLHARFVFGRLVNAHTGRHQKNRGAAD